MIDLLIRRPLCGEDRSVRDLVQSVVDETYGGLWASPPVPIGEGNWLASWIAVQDARIIGVVLTSADWLDDLWVLPEHRGRGVGERLLAVAEAEIAARGHKYSRLRVVQSNARAIDFYTKHGWETVREFAHERFPIAMLEMSKAFE